jgi:hypothetical protein
MFGKRLINTQQGGGCTTETLQILGDTSCVATYRLNGDATDLSGNYNGTATSVTYVAGQFGDAGSFNGSSSTLVVPHSTVFNTSNSFSISVWAYRASTAERIVAFKGTSASQAWFFGYQTSYGYYFYDYGTTSYVRSGTGVTSLNVWENVVLTWNAATKTASIYINDADESNTVVVGGGSGTTSTTDFNIGTGGFPDDWSAWDGKLDQIRIFNKELSSTEVTTVYNEVAC